MRRSPSTVRRIDAAEYERALRHYPAATVFHQPIWIELVARISGGHPVYLAMDGEDGGPPALLPAVHLRRGPFRVLASPPPQAAAPYLGPLFGSGVSAAAVLQHFAGFAREEGVGYLEVRLPPDGPERPLPPVFRPESRTTFVLELEQGEEMLWRESLSPACRRAVRRAAKLGVEVRQEDLASIAPEYARLAAGVFARWNRPPPLDQEDYACVAQAIARGAKALVLVARRGGAIAAAGIFPYDAHTVYYLDGVSDPAHLDARPNNALHWEVIRRALALGLRRYDMVGAGIPGVARFKRTFGPCEVPYLYAWCGLSPWARAARALYATCAPAARALLYRVRRFRTGDA